MAVNVAAAPVGYQGNRDASYWDLLGECLVWCRLCRFCVWLYQRKLAQRSERVKSADLHPTEPWLVGSSCDVNMILVLILATKFTCG